MKFLEMSSPTLGSDRAPALYLEALFHVKPGISKFPDT